MLAIRAARMFAGLHLHSRLLVLVAGDRITASTSPGRSHPPAADSSSCPGRHCCLA
jgi:hypothetical protein